ncbi:UNVERIFIED_ORG: glycosyltransferase involved in cell wall biosynthesis [Arthrobacter sp. UYCu721]
MRGLIAHEWISRHGGSENVLDVMARAAPDDDIYCLWNDSEDRFPGRNIRESWLSKTALRKNKAAALPFMPATWRNVDISRYDSVLVSSHAFAHHIGSPKLRSTIPIHVYVHTPARYIWAAEMDNRGRHPLVRGIAPAFKSLDKKAAAEGPKFAANSSFVRRRIEDSWGADSEVIYPPVRIEMLQSERNWSDRLDLADSATLEALPNDYILGASRFVAYKNLDKVIAVGNACNLPVVLAGSGPEESFLRAKASEAKVPVYFINRPTDELLFALYQRALLFVFPPVEDFGIMPVEAMALGTPVLVNPVGGAIESVRLLGGGATLQSDSTSEMESAARRAISIDMSSAQRKATTFSESAFIASINNWRARSEVTPISYGSGHERT